MNIWMTTKRILRKLGGDKINTVLLPKRELTFGAYDDEHVISVFDPIPFVPIGGQSYKVTWNGTTYDLVGKAVHYDEASGVIIGNASFGDPTLTDNSDLPFAIQYVDAGEQKMFAVVKVMDETPFATISVTTETIHPIDPKYLPGVCLPVVEIGTTFEIGAVLTEEESAKLKELFDKTLPFVIKGNVLAAGAELNGCTSVATTFTIGNNKHISLTASGVSVGIVSSDGGTSWSVAIG